MNFVKHIKGYQLVIVCSLVVVWINVVTCDSLETKNKLPEILHPNGKRFAGSESCEACHKGISETHKLTAHYLTSRPANTETIKGSFESGKNVFELNSHLKLVMQKTSTAVFQVGYVDNWEAIKKPIDIVMGSGRKGQTYLYWNENELFQLPVSYSTPLNTWCNSPGYPTDRILFNRDVPGACLECHGTYFKKISENNKIEAFDKNQIMYGVDCERCHGPAAGHVAFQSSHPEEKKAKYIINPALLSRQQKLDNCALCHSGKREMKKPSFSFVVGDTLDNYSVADYKSDSAAKLDVHGNQYGLLTASKCFKMSTMDCSSCHNVHTKEANNMELFSQRCMTCHTQANHNFCTQPAMTGLTLSKNCIDCHMPSLPSRIIFMRVADKSKFTLDLVRTHLVGIYREQVKQFLEKTNAGKR